MNLHWLRDKGTHKEFNVFWEKGNSDKTFNESDYYTKHHPTIYHRQLRSRYTIDKIKEKVNLLTLSSIRLRGCINPLQTHLSNHQEFSTLSHSGLKDSHGIKVQYNGNMTSDLPMTLVQYSNTEQDSNRLWYSIQILITSRLGLNSNHSNNKYCHWN